MRVVIVDLSTHKEPESVDYHKMKDLGIQLVVVKYSMGGGPDPSADEHSELIRANGLGLGGYHWVDPIQNWSKQADHFLAMLEKWKPEFAMFDVEQWWANWALWYQWLNGEIPYEDVPHCDELEVIGSFEHVYQKVINEWNLPRNRYLIYSGEWFTDMYPNLIQSINHFPGWRWWADYTQVWLENWWVSQETWDWLWDEWLYDREPDRPEGTDWGVWQVQSRIVPPGFRTRLDLNKPHEDFVKLLTDVYSWNGSDKPVIKTPFCDWIRKVV